MKTSINLLIITSFISFSAFSTENPKTDNEQLLLKSCQSLLATPEQEDAKACTYFIQGFITAARTIDLKAINKNQMNRKFTGSMSRPYRNWGQYPQHRFFLLCIPENTSTTHVIMSFSKWLNSQFDTIEILENEVLKALKSEYPCRRPLPN